MDRIMKKIFFILSIIIVINQMEAQTKTEKIFPYEVHKVILNNGFKAILIPTQSNGTVAYYSIVRTGSRDEWEEGKSGFAHFFEHIMFRGTKKYPGSVYDSIVTSIGADANAFTDDDITAYHLKIASEDLEKVMDIESDRFQNLNYSKQEFQTESGAIYGEYRKSVTSPWAIAFEKLRDMAFVQHTYKHTTIGFEKDIIDMPNQYEYSLSFYDRYYRPENVVLLIVGDFDVDKTKDLIKKYYGNWKPGYIPPKIEKEPPQTSPRKMEVEFDGKTLPIIYIGYKTDAFDSKNKNYLSLLLFSDLAFGETSDIYKKLVLKEQKVQFIGGYQARSRDPYLFEITSMVKDENDINYVIQEIDSALNYFKTNLVSEEKLINLKKRMKYSFLMSLESPDRIAISLVNFITLTGDIDVVEDYFNEIQKITPLDIQNAVKYYFVPEKSNTLIVKGKKQ